MEYAAPSGGISSHSLDMAKWMNYLLGQGPPSMDPLYAQMSFIPEMEYGFPPFWQKPNYPETLHFNSHYSRGWFNGRYRGTVWPY